MKMFVALISGALLSSAAVAQHAHGASTTGSDGAAESREATGTEGGSASGNAGANDSANGNATEERRICRRLPSTGTRLGSGERVCMTAEQWRRHRRNN